MLNRRKTYTLFHRLSPRSRRRILSITRPGYPIIGGDVPERIEKENFNICWAEGLDTREVIIREILKRSPAHVRQKVENEVQEN